MKNSDELYLVLQKKWFIEILKGEKKEEYRDFTDYYIDRLGVLDKDGNLIDTKNYDTIRFQLGYAKNAPQIIVECKNVLIDVANDVKDEDDLTNENSNFAIILGSVIEKINCESLNI